MIKPVGEFERTRHKGVENYISIIVHFFNNAPNLINYIRLLNSVMDCVASSAHSR